MKIKLFISIAIAMLAAIFASQNPDGLDKVSEAAGIIGVLLIYILFLFIGYFAKKFEYKYRDKIVHQAE